jgi:2-polyprenyl-3-methyl-5-hydroxy-6-metoxy-1,4-benzoquinol methylase
MAAQIEVCNVFCPICKSTVSNTYSTGFDYEYKTCSNQFYFVYCEQCDVIFLNPRPSFSELPIIYPLDYEPYNFQKKHISYIIRNYIESKKAIKLTNNLPNNAKILDIGCGTTIFLDRLNAIKDKKFELWGNDFDVSACDRIESSGYNVARGRFEEINLSDEYFDMLFLKQVIEHVDNPLAVLEKAYALLRLNGSLIIETPNRDSWDASIFKKNYWGGYHIPRHWTIFNPKSITNLAAKVGFRVKNIEYILSPANWILSFHNALDSNKYVPKFFTKFVNIRNIFFMTLVCSIDFIQKICCKHTSNMRIILEKV